MASIEISAIRKSFGSIEVLRGVDLDVADGEFVVLVGPSGCGKSTLLRMIAGLDDVTSGEIRIAGERVNERAPRDRDIAMVFQSYALYPHMTVAENMSYSLRLRKAARSAIDAAVTRVSGKLGLGDFLQRQPKALSGGQRQRVAMGRAIVRQPKAFLFDEPLSNLDARLREQMRAEIKTLHRDLGATSVYVTHDQIEAMTLADRIVAMNGGAIQQVGAPLDLYDRPANLFVAGFIGSPAMNVLNGTYHRTGVGAAVRVAGTLTVPVDVHASLSDGHAVVIGVRPEHVVPAIAETGSGTGIPARVELVEPTGLGSILHLSASGARFIAFTLTRLPVRPGETMPVSFVRDKIHVFDAGTGRRVDGTHDT